MTENNTSEVVVETPTNAEVAPSAEASVQDLYSKQIMPSNDESDGTSANAPSEGNQTETEKTPEAPVTEEPAEQIAKPSDKTTEETTDTDSKETKPEEADASLIDELLEVEPEANLDDLDVVKKRYSDATRHIGELTEQRNRLDEILSAQGRKIILTKDGPKLAATEDAPELNAEVVDVEEMFNSLKPAEQDLFTDDPLAAVKLLSEKITKRIAEKFLPAEAHVKDAILSQDDCNEVYDDFLASKLRDGKTARFPDAEKPEVVEMMKKALAANTPGMQKLKEAASKDKDLNHVLLELTYLKTWRARQAQLTIQAAAKKAIETKKKEIEGEPSISSSGASQSTKGQQAQAGGNDVQSMYAKGIAAM